MKPSFFCALAVTIPFFSAPTLAQETDHDAAESPTATQPPCSKSVLDFCAKFTDNKHDGNMDLQIGGQTVHLRSGQTANGMSPSFYALSEAKILAQSSLPAALRAKLERQDYFKRLDAFLHQKPFAQMTVDEQTDAQLLGEQLSTTWTSAIDAVVKEQMDAAHPGFHQLNVDETAPALYVEQHKLKNNLLAETYGDLWKNSPDWKRIQDEFQSVKTEYLKMLQEDTNLPAATKKEWAAKISSVNLLIPSSDPQQVDEICATEGEGAFYQSDSNMIKPCAGFFTSGFDMKGVLAHELSHSLGINRTKYLFERQSKAGQMLMALRDQVCHVSTKDGPLQHWKDFQTQLAQALPQLDAFKAPVPGFLACLQYKKTTTPIPGDLSELMQSDVKEMVSSASTDHYFLRLATPKMILKDGSSADNPDYMNPCDRYKSDNSYSPLSSETVGIFFAGDYQNQTAADPAEKMETAIKTTTSMMSAVMTHVSSEAIPFMGNSQMAARGWSEASEERFADAMGFKVAGRLLAKLPSNADRYNTFFSEISTLCPRSDEKSFDPKQQQAEKLFSSEPHSDGEQRLLELMNPTVRKALGCAKDWPGKDCEL